MTVRDLACKLQQKRDCFVKTDEYIIQIYFDGRNGNVKRKNGTVVCRFYIEEDRIMIEPAKEKFPFEFGYIRYEVDFDKEINTISFIPHKDSKEICEVFRSFGM